MSWSLAIDFGTSNTAAAYRINAGKPLPVRLSDQAEQMPSAVLALDSGIVVGAAAVRSARLDPARFEPNPKRRIGEGEVLLGTREYSVAELVAAVLSHVKQRAERMAGSQPLVEVILTFPERWPQSRRDVLREAAVLAGFDPAALRMQTEPVAAASWYAATEPVPPGESVAVFDFGGGTCDVAMLRSEPGGTFAVVAADGADPLGGEHLDQRLLEWTLEQLTRNGYDSLRQSLAEPANLASMLTLREQVRQAKHELSDYESARIPVALGSLQTLVTITASEFDAMIAPEIDAAISLTTGTLRHSGVAPEHLQALYLTGGSSHLRVVHRRMTALLGRPPATLNDPKLVVAQGALLAPDRDDLGAARRPTADRPALNRTASDPPTTYRLTTDRLTTDRPTDRQTFDPPATGPGTAAAGPVSGEPLTSPRVPAGWPTTAGPGTQAGPVTPAAGAPGGRSQPPTVPFSTVPASNLPPANRTPARQAPANQTPANQPSANQTPANQPSANQPPSNLKPSPSTVPGPAVTSGAMGTAARLGTSPIGTVGRGGAVGATGAAGAVPLSGATSQQGQPPAATSGAIPRPSAQSGAAHPTAGGYPPPRSPGPGTSTGQARARGRRPPWIAAAVAALVVATGMVAFLVLRPTDSGGTDGTAGGATGTTATGGGTTTGGSTSTATGPKNCWTGTTVDATSSCPPLQGDAGLQWVFGFESGKNRVCNAQAGALLSTGELEAVVCTSTDVPGVTMWLSRWDSPGSAKSYFSAWNFQDWLLNGVDGAVGSRYDYTDAAGRVNRAYVYADYPFSAQLIVANVDAQGDLDTVDGFMRSATPADLALNVS